MDANEDLYEYPIMRTKDNPWEPTAWRSKIDSAKDPDRVIFSVLKGTGSNGDDQIKFAGITTKDPVNVGGLVQCT